MSSMPVNPLVLLAQHLTDPKLVSEASMKLELGGERRAEAERFFALRDAFGVHGYCDSGAALQYLTHTLQGRIKIS